MNMKISVGFSGDCPAPVECPALTVPENGTVNVSGPQLLGTIATYSCDHGLESGTLVRYCVGVGYWTGTDPKCASG